MHDFRETLDYCQFKNLSTEGNFFVWSNMREGEANIQERLDIFLANPGWLQLYPSMKMNNLITTHSDHTCLMLDTSASVCCSRKGRKPFRFDSMWIGAADCEEIISDS